jgi:hypothetical protein
MVYMMPFAHRYGESSILLPRAKSKWRKWDRLIDEQPEKVRIALTVAAFFCTFLFYVDLVAGGIALALYLPCIGLYTFILSRSAYYHVRGRR